MQITETEGEVRFRSKDIMVNMIVNIGSKFNMLHCIVSLLVKCTIWRKNTKKD